MIWSQAFIKPSNASEQEDTSDDNEPEDAYANEPRVDDNCRAQYEAERQKKQELNGLASEEICTGVEEEDCSRLSLQCFATASTRKLWAVFTQISRLSSVILPLGIKETWQIDLEEFTYRYKVSESNMSRPNTNAARSKTSRECILSQRPLASPASAGLLSIEIQVAWIEIPISSFRNLLSKSNVVKPENTTEWSSSRTRFELTAEYFVDFQGARFNFTKWTRFFLLLRFSVSSFPWIGYALFLVWPVVASKNNAFSWHFFSCNRSKDCPKQESDQWPGMTSLIALYPYFLSDYAARSRFEKRFLRSLKIHTKFGS